MDMRHIHGISQYTGVMQYYGHAMLLIFNFLTNDR